MDQKVPPAGVMNKAKPGLDPRNALDILDIRTARQQDGGTAELAARTAAGPDVLNYLATHGKPATRAAVAAIMAAPADTKQHLADDDNENDHTEQAKKNAHQKPGLSE